MDTFLIVFIIFVFICIAIIIFKKYFYEKFNTVITTILPPNGLTGECRTANNKFPPFASRYDTFDNCKKWCLGDLKCSGYAYYPVNGLLKGNCKVYDITSANKPGRDISNTPLTQADENPLWKCYFNTLKLSGFSDKGCWTESPNAEINTLNRTISPIFLNMTLLDTSQTIWNNTMTRSINITIPSVYPDGSQTYLNTMSSSNDLTAWNKFALFICIKFNFDTFGYQAGNRLFFGNYNTVYTNNNTTYNYTYDKQTAVSGTCLMFGDVLINHVYSKLPEIK